MTLRCGQVGAVWHSICKLRKLISLFSIEAKSSAVYETGRLRRTRTLVAVNRLWQRRIFTFIYYFFCNFCLFFSEERLVYSKWDENNHTGTGRFRPLLAAMLA